MAVQVKAKTRADVTYMWGQGTVSEEVTKIHTQDIAKAITRGTGKRGTSKEEPTLKIKTAERKTVLNATSEVMVKLA
ncbi:DUF2945 domain-containing protein [Methylobacterium sp. P31]